MRRAIRSHLGSAHRLSQPPSGFLAVLSFEALFRASTVPGILPLEHSLRTDRAPLSRPLCFLAVIHPRAETCCPSALSPPFSPTSTLSRSCLDPTGDYGRSFHKPKLATCSPWTPRNRTVPVLPASPYFEASIPLRIRSRPARVASSWRPILSWVSSPIESSPTAPWVLYPPRPRGPEHSPSPEGSGLATKRILQPL